MAATRAASDWFNCFVPTGAPRWWPIRTTTRSCEGTMKVCCPPAPDMK